MGIRLLRGRALLPTDDRRAGRVVVVDELLAKRFFGGRDPIGRRLVYDIGFGATRMRSWASLHRRKENGLAAKTSRRPTHRSRRSSAATARKPSSSSVSSATPTPIAHAQANHRESRSERTRVRHQDNQRSDSAVRRTSYQFIPSSRRCSLSWRSFLASSVSTGADRKIVSQRRREIAVRIALGASHSHVMDDVFRQALVLTALGIAIGSGAAWLLTRALAGLFLGVGPTTRRSSSEAPPFLPQWRSPRPRCPHSARLG